jgi:hypothetical protein
MPRDNFKVGELLNKRSLFSKTWINFDGSYTTQLYNTHVHFEDYEGNLHNINTDLTDEADLFDYAGPIELYGKDLLLETIEKSQTDLQANKLNRDNYDFQGLNVPFLAKIPRNFKRGYQIGHGDVFLHYKPINASPATGIIDDENKNCVHYQDVWNDADVCLELKNNGIKETIVLKTDKAPNTFTFEVDGPLEDDLTAGTLQLMPAWLEDAAGTKRDVSQTVRRVGDVTYIDLEADLDGLVYPIYIDPTTTLQPDPTAGIDTQIGSSTGGPSNLNYGTSTTLRVGTTTQTDIWRSMIKFDLSSIPSQSLVSSAYFNLLRSGSFDSTTQTIDVQRILDDWNESTVTWNTQPSVTGTGLVTFTVAGSSPGNVDITTFVQNWLNGTYPNYGFKLSSHSEITTNTWKEFYSSDAGSAFRPSLTVIYNAPPTKPSLLTPDGGENINSTFNITWFASTDAEVAQSTIKYQIQLSTNNGSTWKDIVPLTAPGQTSYTYDFINETASSTCLIRIRAYDGTIYGNWDQSAGVFTIEHNLAPNAPINLNPTIGIKDRAAINRLSWTHSDSNTNDPQSKFDLQWRLQGSGTWNTVTQTTTNNYWDAPANTFPAGVIEWQVRTYDQTGLVGPYNTVVAFTAANKPAAPTFITPTNGATIPTARPVVQWSSPAQTDYDLQVLDATGATILWQDTKTSTNKAVTVGIDLSNSTTYKLKLAVKDAGGLWSNYTTIDINVSYTAPAKPTVNVTKDDLRGSVALEIKNLTPSGTVPAVSKMDVFRRGTDGNFIRIAKDLVADIAYTDSKTATLDFTGKVTTSTVENPNIFWTKLNQTSLIDPSTIADTISQVAIDSIKTLNGAVDTRSTTTNLAYGQQAFSFDLVKGIERVFGTIPGTLLADKVQFLIDKVKNLTFDWWGYGSGPSGVKVYTSMWRNTTGWYTPATHSNSTVTKLSRASAQTSIYITSDGFLHGLAYADPSNGTILSSVSTDYASSTIDIDYVGLKTTFTDYEAIPNTNQDYFARVYGSNGTFTDSDIITVNVGVELTQLSLVSDPTKIVTMRKGTTLSKSSSVESEKMQFVGRPYPLTEFGTNKESQFEYKYLIFSWADLQMIEFLAAAGETLLLRDNLGRKEYVTVTEIQIDEGPICWEISIKPEKVYYVEGV